MRVRTGSISAGTRKGNGRRLSDGQSSTPSSSSADAPPSADSDGPCARRKSVCVSARSPQRLHVFGVREPLPGPLCRPYAHRHRGHWTTHVRLTKTFHVRHSSRPAIPPNAGLMNPPIMPPPNSRKPTRNTGTMCSVSSRRRRISLRSSMYLRNSTTSSPDGGGLRLSFARVLTVRPVEHSRHRPSHN